MTSLATLVAEQDKENVGFSGKAASRKAVDTPRQALSTRSNSVSGRIALLSKTMSATSASQRLAQAPAADQVR